jgi:hypothetical protein
MYFILEFEVNLISDLTRADGEDRCDNSINIVGDLGGPLQLFALNGFISVYREQLNYKYC